MKKIILFLIIVISSMTSFAQAQDSVKNESTQQSLISVSYRLFPTQNMWTFIKLNTRNGEMWQVQYNMEDNKRFESDLNFIRLVAKEDEVNDRFTLYPTQNIYTFILLDQINGRTWQVQWSLEPEKRIVIPIE